MLSICSVVFVLAIVLASLPICASKVATGNDGRRLYIATIDKKNKKNFLDVTNEILGNDIKKKKKQKQAKCNTTRTKTKLYTNQSNMQPCNIVAKKLTLTR